MLCLVLNTISIITCKCCCFNISVCVWAKLTFVLMDENGSIDDAVVYTDGFSVSWRQVRLGFISQDHGGGFC